MVKAISLLWDGPSSRCCSLSSCPPAALAGAGSKPKQWWRRELTLQLFFGGKEGGLFSGDEISYSKIECFLLMLVNGTPGKRSTLVPITGAARPSAAVGQEFIPFHTYLKRENLFFFLLLFYFFCICNEFKAGAQPAKLPLICCHINILCLNMCLIAQISQTCYLSWAKKNGP